MAERSAEPFHANIRKDTDIMIFEQIKCGGDRNFAYIIGDEDSRKAALVDPAYNTKGILARTDELKLQVVYVINTHGHFDHAGGNSEVCGQTGAQVIAHESAAGADVPAADGGSIEMGDVTLKFIHTPGHTPDSMCVLTQGHLCTGDTLFVGKVGGTGFGEDAREEYDSLHTKLMTLDDDVKIYPGHDVGVRPVSTIGAEKKENPFLLRPDFESFLDLKKNWSQYKIEHGIA
jgi:glyoxylase-like metal-dependent hydrolase (beta-lactamase superfamily II)